MTHVDFQSSRCGLNCYQCEGRDIPAVSVNHYRYVNDESDAVLDGVSVGDISAVGWALCRECEIHWQSFYSGKYLSDVYLRLVHPGKDPAMDFAIRLALFHLAGYDDMRLAPGDLVEGRDMVGASFIARVVTALDHGEVVMERDDGVELRIARPNFLSCVRTLQFCDAPMKRNEAGNGWVLDLTANEEAA